MLATVEQLWKWKASDKPSSSLWPAPATTGVDLPEVTGDADGKSCPGSSDIAES